MPKTNTERKSPKGNIRFSISLSKEQKEAKSLILERPFNFIVGKKVKNSAINKNSCMSPLYFINHK